MRPLLATLAVFAIGACTPHEVPRTVQENPLTPAPHAEETQSLTRRKGEVAIDKLNGVYQSRFQLDAQIAKATPEELMKTLADLTPFILRPDYLNDARTKNSEELTSVLALFNAALVRVLETKPNLIEGSSLLTDYANAVFADCDENLKGCFALPFFSRDHLTADIFVHMVKRLDPQITALRAAKTKVEQALRNNAASCDVGAQGPQPCPIALAEVNKTYLNAVDRYYRFLYAGVYEIKNRPRLADPDILYVRHAADYFEKFNMLPPTEKKRLQNLAYYKRHRDILQVILYDLSAQGGKIGLKSSLKGNLKSKEYCDFVIDLKPYSFSEAGGGNLDKRGLREFVSDFINCASDRGQLGSLMGDYVKSLRETAEANRKAVGDSSQGRVVDASYFYAYRDLAETPFFLHNLGIRNDAKDDIGFYIVDRLFYEDIDLQTALAYWHKTSGMDDGSFLALVKNYLRVQIAYQMKASILVFAQELRARTAGGSGITTDIFSDLVQAVNMKVQFDWQILKTRVGFVKEFLIQTMDDRYNQRIVGGGEKSTSKDYVSLKNQLAALNDHLNYASVSPLMLPLTYYMAKATGSIDFVVPWWTGSNPHFKMDARQALGSFFEGTADQAQLFNFGDQSFHFDPLERLHVFDLALRTGIFEFVPFDLVKDVTQKRKRLQGYPAINNELMLFQQYFDDSLKLFRDSISTSITSLDKVARGANFREGLLGACRNPLTAPVSLSLSELTTHTLSQDKNLLEPSSTLYSSMSFLSSWKMAKDRARLMIAVLHDYLYAADAEQRLPAEKFQRRDEIYQAVQDELEQYLSLERTYLRKFFALDKQIVNAERDCLAILLRADFLRRDQITGLNVDYYKDVHAAMTLLSVAEGIDDGPLERAATLDRLKNLIFGWHDQELNNKDADEKIGDFAAKVGDVTARMNRLADTALSDAVWNHVSDLDFHPRLESVLNDMLGIHNFLQAPYVNSTHNGIVSAELGFFVNGVPSWPGGPKIKRANSITKSRFIQGRWDATARVRRQLQTATIPVAFVNARLGLNITGSGPDASVRLAPNVDVPLGSVSELENDSFYSSTLRDNVQYNLDPSSFVRDAMIQFAGYPPGGSEYLAWYSTSGLDIAPVRQRLNFLLSLLKDNVEVSDTPKEVCPKDMWGQPVPSDDPDCKVVQIKADDVIQYFLSFTDILNITPEDQTLLGWMDRPTKMGDDVKRLFEYHYPSSTLEWTYFDQFYRSKLTSQEFQSAKGTVLGEHLDDEETFDEHSIVVRSRLREDQHLFPLNPTVTQLARTQIRGHIQRHLDVVHDFERAARQREDEAGADRRKFLPEIIFERETTEHLRSDENYKPGNWRFMGVAERSGGPRAHTPIYLRDDRDSAQAWFRGYVASFYIKSTECAAMPKPGDPDYSISQTVLEGLSGQDCETRYAKWQTFMDQRTSAPDRP